MQDNREPVRLADMSVTVTTPTINKLDEVKEAVQHLSVSEREQLREYVAHLVRLDDPEYLRALSEASERMAAGDRVSMDEFIRENAGPEMPA